MPETSMHENGNLQPWKHQIGCARQISSIKSVPVFKLSSCLTYGQLGLGVLAADAAHHAGTDNRTNGIHTARMGPRDDIARAKLCRIFERLIALSPWTGSCPMAG